VQGEIRLVVFDLGRVLVRICDSWTHAAELAKLPMKLPDMSETTRAALREQVFASEKGRITQEQFCNNAAEILNLPAQHVTAMSNIFLIETFPGVRMLLQDILRGGAQTACLSNNNSSHWKIMSEPGMECSVPFDRLTHHFASHLIGLRKPDPKIYAYVEQQTKFAGAQIIFFDDLIENVQAARQRGWRAEQILPDSDPVAQMRRHLQPLNVFPNSSP
jgi:putative hydrolase of the HAD superfamily